MLKLIIGVKGAGKTKTLLDMVNNAADSSSGSVVCIEKGTKLKYDVKYQVRLIDTSDYDINNGESLYGMVSGSYATNYDITHIFVDSALKICNQDMDGFLSFLKKADEISSKFNFECIVTSSIAPQDLPEEAKKYLLTMNAVN